MGKRIKSEKKGGGGKESKFIEEYTPLVFSCIYAGDCDAQTHLIPDHMLAVCSSDRPFEDEVLTVK